MVVHSPDKFEVQRAAAAAAAAAPAQTPGGVPPSVLASGTSTAASVSDELLARDFDSWNGVHPPTTQAQVHSGGEERAGINFATGRTLANHGLTVNADEDKLSLIHI